MPELFAAIGGIVVVALVVAWRVRFRSRPYESDRAIVSEPAPSAHSLPPVEAPLPPSAFLAAVENALGQPVISLRLRTPSNVFKLEPPQPNG